MQKTITHANFAKGFRGGERQTLLLVKELAKKGYAQKLLTRRDSDLAKRCAHIRNLDIVEIKKPYIFYANKIKGSAIIHAHETKAAQFAYFVHLFYKIPYIITRRVDNPIKKNLFNKNIYENSATTAVLSSAIKCETLKVSPSIRTEVIPSAYSALGTNQESVKSIAERFAGKFLIGNIGELDNTQKGQYYLIEAAKIVQKKHPDIHFIFLGKGRDEQNYKLQAASLENITFEGFVNNVGDYIANFRLFVFPSLNEGLGSILFDVMQQKVPIIASDVGGIPDIVHHENNGLLVPPKSAEAIADAIEKLYNDKEKAAKLALEAYEDIENFSALKMCERYEALYKEFIR